MPAVDMRIASLPLPTWPVVGLIGALCAGILVWVMAVNYLGWGDPQGSAGTQYYTCGPRGSIVLATHDCETADPVADAQAAIKSGDMRLLAVAGDGESILGAPDEQYDWLRRRFGVRFLYSGCVVYSAEEERYRRVADAYGERYNEVVLQAVRD